MKWNFFLFFYLFPLYFNSFLVWRAGCNLWVDWISIYVFLLLFVERGQYLLCILCMQVFRTVVCVQKRIK